MTSPVIKLEAIAQACRPMAALLLASSTGPDPSTSELAEARAQLAGARRAPGRIGWAIDIILEGGTIGSRMEQAIDIVLGVAGDSTPGEISDTQVQTAFRHVIYVLGQPRSWRGNGSNRPKVLGLD